MIWTNTPQRWGVIAKFFHWTVGVLVLFMLALGLYTALYQMFDAAKIQTLLNEGIEGSGGPDRRASLAECAARPVSAHAGGKDHWQGK